MDTQSGRNEGIEKIRELVRGIDFGMLTTVDNDGTLHSRPMSTNGDVEFDGDLWFFTDINSHKVEEIRRCPRVNVSLANPKKQSYVSLSGQAEIRREQTQIERLWKPELKAWFPEGKDDPNIALIKVEVEQAEYWDSPSSLVAQTVAMGKALLTGKPPVDMGEHEKMKLAA